MAMDIIKDPSFQAGAWDTIKVGTSSAVISTLAMGGLNKWETLPPIREWLSASFLKKEISSINTKWDLHLYWKVGGMLGVAAAIDCAICRILIPSYRHHYPIQEQHLMQLDSATLSLPSAIPKQSEDAIPMWLRASARITAIALTVIIFYPFLGFQPMFFANATIDLIQIVIPAMKDGPHALNSQPIPQMFWGFYPVLLDKKTAMFGLMAAAGISLAYLATTFDPIKCQSRGSEEDYQRRENENMPEGSDLERHPVALELAAATSYNPISACSQTIVVHWHDHLEMTKAISDAIQRQATPDEIKQYAARCLHDKRFHGSLRPLIERTRDKTSSNNVAAIKAEWEGKVRSIEKRIRRKEIKASSCLDALEAFIKCNNEIQNATSLDPKNHIIKQLIDQSKHYPLTHFLEELEKKTSIIEIKQSFATKLSEIQSMALALYAWNTDRSGDNLFEVNKALLQEKHDFLSSNAKEYRHWGIQYTPVGFEDLATHPVRLELDAIRDGSDTIVVNWHEHLEKTKAISDRIQLQKKPAQVKRQATVSICNGNFHESLRTLLERTESDTNQSNMDAIKGEWKALVSSIEARIQAEEAAVQEWVQMWQAFHQANEHIKNTTSIGQQKHIIEQLIANSKHYPLTYFLEDAKSKTSFDEIKRMFADKAAHINTLGEKFMAWNNDKTSANFFELRKAILEEKRAFLNSNAYDGKYKPGQAHKKAYLNGKVVIIPADRVHYTANADDIKHLFDTAKNFNTYKEISLMLLQVYLKAKATIFPSRVETTKALLMRCALPLVQQLAKFQ